MSTAERRKDERMTKFTTVIFKMMQRVSQKKEKKKRENIKRLYSCQRKIERRKQEGDKRKVYASVHI